MEVDRQEIDARSDSADSDQYPDQINFYSYAKLPDEPHDKGHKNKKPRSGKVSIWLLVFGILMLLSFLAVAFYMPDVAQQK